jgi:flagellar biosynthesis protein FlhG
MVSSERQARSVFGVLSKVSDQYLDIQLDLLGWVPHDDSWRRAVLERRLAFATNPAAAASRCIQRVAERLIALDAADGGKRAGIGALLLGGQG